jgi:hypothetical protein
MLAQIAHDRANQAVREADRAEAVAWRRATFVDELFSRADKLKSSGFDTKWNEHHPASC